MNAERSPLDGLRRHLEATEGAPVELVETHISWVLLTRRFAYKLKKPVNLGFVNFSSPASRRQACEDELRLNRRLAPDLYLEVLPVRGPATQARLDAASPEQTGQAIDWVVKMKRFNAGSLWSERVAQGALLPIHIDAFALRLARFHANAARATVGEPWGDAERCAAPALRSLATLEGMRPDIKVTALRHWLHAQSNALAPRWASRKTQGFVRECHGDLHLANLVVLDATSHSAADQASNQEVTAFDCLEFDPELRWIDVLSDVAFLAMDLWAHGRQDLSYRFLNAYLEHTGDYAGLPVLRYYMVYRALVRAQVAWLAPSKAGQPDYLALAQQLARETPPRLLLTSGLPGSGKSHASQELLEAAGAIRIRSDVERKRLHGLSARQDSRTGGIDIYTPEATEKTLARLQTLARCALQAGYCTIVDAASLRRAERLGFAALARDLGVAFTLMQCDAPMPLLRQRVQDRASRRDDASEADLQVLEHLQALREPLSEDEQAYAWHLDTQSDASPDQLASRWLRLGSQTPSLHR